MSKSGLTPWERTVLAEVSGDRMSRHLEWFNTINRVSGTPDDWRAAEYVADELKSLGIPVEIHEFEGLISIPIRASLRITGPVEQELQAKTRAFSGASHPAGLSGELVYVPTKVAGLGVLESAVAGDEYSGYDVKGKIVLSQRGGPDGVEDAERAGAIGFVHLWPSDEDVVHEMTVGPVWGTPTPESSRRLVRIPAVAVRRSEGLRLKGLCEQGPVSVLLRTEVDTRWRRLLLPVATIQGKEPDLFALIGGHLDSWYVGITDNATGNVCCLELARILHQYRDQLTRSVKLAWWPGHSYGRYAGSTWFCDNFWTDLHYNCLTYDNIDSPGVMGADDYRIVTAMAETRDLVEFAVREITGQQSTGTRPQRAGDQSFWGPGVPSIFMLLSERPGSNCAVGGSGGGWWWHSEYDTLDKCDPEVLVRDTKIHLLANLRLLNSPVLPFTYSHLGDEFVSSLCGYAEQAGDAFDLGPTLEEAREFQQLTRRLDAAVESVRKREGSKTDLHRLNRDLMSISRVCIPVLYTRTGQFEQESATPVPGLPGLANVADLLSLDRDSDAFRFLKTKLVRQRNRVRHALAEASELAEGIVSRLERAKT